MKNYAQALARCQSPLLAALLATSLIACQSNQSKPDAEAPAPVVAEKAAAPAVAEAPKAESKPVCKEEPATAKSKKKTSKKSKAAEPVDCVPAATASAPQAKVVASTQGAAAAPAPQATTSGAYDLSKNKPVTDSTKVESGQGTLVKGLNDWQGEITGVPAANSKFTRLKIGMAQKQVTDLIGEPTDQGAYVTGKAFIPFYFGSDKTRWEMVYKGQGRLIFSNQSGFGTGYYLTWVIHNANEGGYR